MPPRSFPPPGRPGDRPGGPPAEKPARRTRPEPSYGRGNSGREAWLGREDARAHEDADALVEQARADLAALPETHPAKARVQSVLGLPAAERLVIEVDSVDEALMVRARLTRFERPLFRFDIKRPD